MLKKNDRKALKASLDLYENGGLFYWQLHIKIGCQSHLPGVDLHAKNTTFELKFYRHYPGMME